jgi:hypothetical protein
MKFIIGFDPGGEKSFGWCLAKYSEIYPLNVVKSGCVNNASEALQVVKRLIPDNVSPLAAGIDAPLFWRSDGDRKADLNVRQAIRRRGAPSPGGTVQHVNSLRGACLAQGMMISVLLKELWPTILITESHPKALRFLMPDADSRLEGFHPQTTEHELDAGLGALTAWALLVKPAGWQDLSRLDERTYTLLGATPAYMMYGSEA